MYKNGILIFLVFVLITSCVGKSKQQESNTNKKPEGYALDLNDLSSEQIYYILNDDIIGFFPELKSIFNTELQKKHFPESEEYKKFKPIIDELRNDVIQNKFRIDVTKSITFEKYDIKDQGFYFLKDNIDWIKTQAIWSIDEDIISEIEGFYSNDNAFYRGHIGFKEIEGMKLFIPATEEKGLLFEKYLNDFKFILSFNVESNPKQIIGIEFIDEYKMLRIKNVKYEVYVDEELILMKEIDD